MATTTNKTNKPILPRGVDNRPVDSYNRAKLFSGKALDFDGVNDYVTISDNAALDFGTGDFSVAFVMKSDVAGFDRILDKRNGTSGYTINIGPSKNIVLELNDGTGSSQFATSSVYADGKLKHVVISFNRSGNADFYINGAFDEGVDISSKAGNLDSTSDLFIGADAPSGTGIFYDGQLSGLKMYSTALTAAQVADLYNNPEKVVPTGVANTALKLWLPMQEGAGTTAYDGSSKENGPDLIVNGDFATDSDWTKGAGWSIGGGVASHDASLGPGDLYQDFNLNVGSSYKITIEITATDTTELYFMTDSGDYVEVTGSPIGVHSHVFVADESSHRVGVRGSGNWDGSVDNITLEELNFANHGTISGATYTHGIGAPVSQTAVIDWNKGTNLATFSEDFSDSDWIALTSTKISTSETDPIGGSTALNVSWSNGAAAYLYQAVAQTGAHTVSMYVKSNGGGNDFRLFGDGVGQNSSTLTATNEWQRFDFSFTGAGGSSWGIRGVSGQAADLLVAFAQLEANSSVGPYVPTIATAQTSPVLLPQGLTTGRDITGVNLFENVRKQGALNLDGNSWAEVHDNASLDITDAITLEAWVYWDGTSAKGIFGRWDLVNNKRSYLLYTSTPARFNFFVSSNGTLNTNQQNNTDISTGWNHIAGVYDGANIITYLNGSSDGSKNYSSDIYANDVDIEIGRYDLNSANAYPNQLAQPRIYNRALTAEEVQRNYNAGKNIYTN